MAYRRSTRKRTTRKRTPWRRTAGKLLDITGRNGVKYLKRKLGLNTENKFLDSQTLSTCPTTLAIFQNPLIIPQGDGESERDGSSVRVTSISSTFRIETQLNTTANCLVRILGVYTPTTNGDFPTQSEVLTTNTDIDSYYTKNRSGYNIVFDKTFNMGGTNDACALPVIRDYKFRHSVLDHQCVWNTADTTGARNAMLRGDFAYYVMSYGSATILPSLTITSRANFVDN